MYILIKWMANTVSHRRWHHRMALKWKTLKQSIGILHSKMCRSSGIIRKYSAKNNALFQSYEANAHEDK